ncbi:MAG: DUF2752 domain-containing protein [Lachnospiraceae bacterium]|nr:DUF2752 domain-containing protein [Lachnospiraceae bacterium]
MSKKPLAEGQLLYRITGVFLFLVAIYAVFTNIVDIGLSSPKPCLLNEKWHLYCPGCGGTRAFHLMLHGRIIESLEYNAFVVPAFAFILYYFIGVTLAVWSKGTKIYFHLRKWMLVVTILILIWLTFGRNLCAIYLGYDPIGDIASFHH